MSEHDEDVPPHRDPINRVIDMAHVALTDDDAETAERFVSLVTIQEVRALLEAVERRQGGGSER